MNHITNTSDSTAVAPEAAWRRSTYSDQSGGNCVEIADLSGQVGMRDSKAKRGPAVLVSDSAFEAFVESLSA
ncbi:DUF397 domain-containing protein [Streptomyces acidiscabies]|uniref:DUF397 domain-containing protein n=1 Tax=Streptomyces acidiscabies TaxID=42234 RepID=UPI000962B004|nr:DUF397 domain-containing protein [Streptomyces acidiscabies]GAV38304.1 hypothetical protein Saa2_01183 [Streptomyces acidiscabies]